MQHAMESGSPPPESGLWCSAQAGLLPVKSDGTHCSLQGSAPAAAQLCNALLSVVLQVDLAHGPDYQWVAYKLTQLCKDMGTAVTQLPGERGLQLTAGAEVKWSRGSAAAAAAAGQEDIVCA